MVKFKLFSVSHECCDMTPGDVFEENIPEVVLLELLHIEVVDQILEIYWKVGLFWYLFVYVWNASVACIVSIAWSLMPAQVVQHFNRISIFLEGGNPLGFVC